jgi:L-threonylcarbamoyladenylate synthase
LKRIRINDDSSALEEAAGVLSEGGIVAYPTETFYALGVRFDHKAALERLFDLKNREEQAPFPLILPSVEDAERVASSIPPLAQKLIEKYWPGPLTIVLPALPGLSGFLALKGTVAVRVPGESPALELARVCGFPITATSANPSGSPSPETAENVLEYFDQGIDLVLDGGRTPGGLASTIVDATGEKIVVLREGAIKVETG